MNFKEIKKQLGKLCFLIIDCLIYLFVRFFVGLIYFLPEKISERLCQWIVKGMLFIIPRFKSVAIRNLEIAFPDKPVEELEIISSNALNLLSRNIYLFSQICKIKPEETLKNSNYKEMKEFVDLVRDSSPTKSVIIATGHFSPFEYLVQQYASLGKPPAVMARGFGLPIVDKWLDKKRSEFGLQFFFRKGGFKIIRKYLLEGRDVLTLPDQNVKANHADFVDFLGIKASATRALALASIRTGAPIVAAVLVEGKEKGGVEFLIREVVVSDDLESEEKITQINQQIHSLFEEGIRKWPDAWLWIHRRFKTRPNKGIESIYDDCK